MEGKACAFLGVCVDGWWLGGLCGEYIFTVRKLRIGSTKISDSRLYWF